MFYYTDIYSLNHRIFFILDNIFQFIAQLSNSLKK